jgi:hypothetical protein
MNDERPVEKLLRRYSKKRRENAGEPLQIHPATRRMLQGEVARRFPRRAASDEGEATTFAQVLKLWRRQLPWALPVLIVLTVGVWVLVGPSKKSSPELSLAKSASAPAAPAEEVQSSFRGLEATIPAPPAPATGFGDQPALAYAQSSPTRDGLELNGLPFKDETIRLKQGVRTPARELSGISDKETALTLKTSGGVANDFGQKSPDAQFRGQTLAAKSAPFGAPNAFYEGKMQIKSPAAAAPTKSDSLESLERIRSEYVASVADTRAGTSGNKLAAIAPQTSSARYFRQAAGNEGDHEQQRAYLQAFVNRAPDSSYGRITHSTVRSPVLAKFQVEQTGDQLRVIDGDGSTYVGEMNSPVGERIVRVEEQKKGERELKIKGSDPLALDRLGAAQLSDQQSAQNLMYRVSGTNHTLNQQVVFTWSFVALTNQLAAAQIKAVSAGGNVMQNNLPSQQLPLLLNNSIINGRAQLGGGREIEVNAVPVSP